MDHFSRCVALDEARKPHGARIVSLAPGVIALSLGMRFLTDHLLGDTYFKISFPGHNLVRARTQCAILAAVQAQQGALSQLVATAVAQRLRAA